MAAVLVCLFIANDIGWAQPADYVTPKNSTLATPSVIVDPEFREKTMIMQSLLAAEGVGHYIAEQVKREKEIFGKDWEMHRKEIVSINDPKTRGLIKKNVRGLEFVVFVRVSGLLASTGQFAHVGLSGRDYDGLPVIYVDASLSNTKDLCIQKHDIDEMLQWENLRVNVLHIGTRWGMRKWIRGHIDTPDEELEGTEYEGLTSRRIAKTFHKNSYPLDSLQSTMKTSGNPRDSNANTYFDYEYITFMLTYGTDEESKDVNIAAGPEQPATPISSGREAFINSLIDNPWMRQIFMREGERPEQLLKELLNSGHPLIIRISSEVAKLDDKTIEDEGRKILNWYCTKNSVEYLKHEEFILHPTQGLADFTQIVGDLRFSAHSLLSVYDKDKTRIREAEYAIRKLFIFIKSIEVISRKTTGEELCNAGALLRLKRYLSSLDLDPEASDARNLLYLSELVIPADTPDKIKALNKLIDLIDGLAKRKKTPWCKLLSTDESRQKINHLKILAEPALPSYAEETLDALETSEGNQAEAAKILGFTDRRVVFERMKRIRKNADKNNYRYAIERLNRISAFSERTTTTLKALKKTHGNREKAAGILGITVRGLEERIYTIRKSGDKDIAKQLNSALSLSTFKEITIRALEKSAGDIVKAAKMLHIAIRAIKYRIKSIREIAARDSDMDTLDRLHLALGLSMVSPANIAAVPDAMKSKVVDVVTTSGKGEQKKAAIETVIQKAHPSPQAKIEFIERVGIAVRSMEHSVDTLNAAEEIGMIVFCLRMLAKSVPEEFSDICNEAIRIEFDMRSVIRNISEPSKAGKLSYDDARINLNKFSSAYYKLKLLKEKIDAREAEFNKICVGCKEPKVALDNLLEIKLSLANSAAKLESRIEFVNMEVPETRCYPAEILKDICSKRHNVRVETNGNDTVITSANALSLKSALSNIINNAIYATEKRYKKQRDLDSHNVVVSLEVESGSIIIRIKDEASGIKKEFDTETGRDRIFNLNVFGSESGTGLGTTEAWYTVKDLGGSIDFESKLGKGTTFILRLPAVSSESSGQVIRLPVAPKSSSPAEEGEAGVSDQTGPWPDQPMHGVGAAGPIDTENSADDDKDKAVQKRTEQLLQDIYSTKPVVDESEFNELWNGVTRKYKELVERFKRESEERESRFGYAYREYYNPQSKWILDPPMELPGFCSFRLVQQLSSDVSQALHFTFLFEEEVGNLVFFDPCTSVEKQSGPMLALSPRKGGLIRIRLIIPDSKEFKNKVEETVRRYAEEEYKMNPDILLREEGIAWLEGQLKDNKCPVEKKKEYENLLQRLQKEVADIRHELAKERMALDKLKMIVRERVVAEVSGAMEEDAEYPFADTVSHKELGLSSPLDLLKRIDGIYPVAEQLLLKGKIPDKLGQVLSLSAGISESAPAVDTKQMPKPQAGSEDRIDIDISNISDDYDEGRKTIVEVAKELMEEMLPRFAHSEENMYNFDLLIFLLIKALEDDSCEANDKFFIRQAVSALEEHREDTEETELKKDLKDIYHKMHALRVFFASYNWYVRAREVVGGIRAKLNAGQDISSDLYGLYKLIGANKESPINEFARLAEVIDEVPRNPFGVLSNMGIYHIVDWPNSCIFLLFGKVNFIIQGNIESIDDFEKILDNDFAKSMAAIGYFILKNQWDKEENYNPAGNVKEDVANSIYNDGWTFDKVAAELNKLISSAAAKTAGAEDEDNPGEISREIIFKHIGIHAEPAKAISTLCSVLLDKLKIGIYIKNQINGNGSQGEDTLGVGALKVRDNDKVMVIAESIEGNTAPRIMQKALDLIEQLLQDPSALESGTTVLSREPYKEGIETLEKLKYAQEAAATGNEQLTDRNRPDIEKLPEASEKLIPELEKQDGMRYYTIRYDTTKIVRSSPAEALLKAYVETVLPLKLPGKDRVSLKPFERPGEGLISVQSYRDQERSQKIGESHVDINEDITGKALRIIGMMNMALVASSIPNDLAADEINKYDMLISFLKAQYKDMTGEELIDDLLKDTSRGIWIRLPRAERIPPERIEEYYRLTIAQLLQSA